MIRSGISGTQNTTAIQLKRRLDMKQWLCLLLAFVMATSLCACGGNQAETADAPTWQEQYDLGIRYLSDGNYEEAIIAFMTAIEIDPKQADAYIGLADAYVNGGNVEQALRVIQDALDELGDMGVLLEKLSELTPREDPGASEREWPIVVAEAEVLSVQGTLELSQLMCYLEQEEDGSEWLRLEFSVNNPETVRNVNIMGAIDYLSWTDADVEESIAYWKEEGLLFGDEAPPFWTEVGIIVFPEDRGEPMDVLLLGTDEDGDFVGAVGVTVDIP